jgi:hypothetical protein
LKLQQIPKYEKIDYPPVNHPSDWVIMALTAQPDIPVLSLLLGAQK